MTIVEGGCDLLLCYHHPRQPVQLDAGRYDMLVLGHETLRPYARCDRAGIPDFMLPGDIRAPLFVVSTETDHVAPWRSVYKLSHLTPAEFTFVLTSGGHNAGIVSEPGHPHRHFRIAQRQEARASPSHDQWGKQAELQEGSWWLAWTQWLDERSADKLTRPPEMGGPGRASASMEAAPGSYVMQR